MKRLSFLCISLVCLLLIGGCNKNGGQEIKGFWKRFTKTVKTKNFKTFKEVSLPKIECMICLENSAAEDSVIMRFKADNPDSWNDKLYGELLYIPINRFIEQDFKVLFTESLISKMRNSSNVNFISREFVKGHGQHYLDDFLEEGKKYLLHEILITTEKPSTQFEGAQVVLQILETEKGLKFYGYSTIP